MVYQASQSVGPEKNLKVQKEEESAKPKPVETKKVWWYQGDRGASGSLVFCSFCLHFQYRLMQPSKCQCLYLSTSELSHLVKIHSKKYSIEVHLYFQSAWVLMRTVVSGGISQISSLSAQPLVSWQTEQLSRSAKCTQKFVYNDPVGSIKSLFFFFEV